MNEDTKERYLAFAGPRRIASGGLAEVAAAVKRHVDSGAPEAVAVLDAVTSKPIDLDLHGTLEDVQRRLEITTRPPAPRGPGRPKLGVVSREVSLLPRHWEWLAAQPGGASGVLRRLVDEARRTGAGREQARLSQEAAYRFMYAMAGDLPGFEDASRALYRAEYAVLDEIISAWPEDIRDHARTLISTAERDQRAAGPEAS